MTKSDREDEAVTLSGKVGFPYPVPYLLSGTFTGTAGFRDNNLAVIALLSSSGTSVLNKDRYHFRNKIPLMSLKSLLGTGSNVIIDNLNSIHCSSKIF